MLLQENLEQFAAHAQKNLRYSDHKSDVIVRYLVKDRQEEKSPRVRPMVPA